MITKGAFWTAAVVSVLALTGCEIVGGIKRRPLASERGGTGGGGTGGLTGAGGTGAAVSGAAGTTGSGGAAGTTGAGGVAGTTGAGGSGGTTGLGGAAAGSIGRGGSAGSAASGGGGTTGFGGSGTPGAAGTGGSGQAGRGGTGGSGSGGAAAGGAQWAVAVPCPATAPTGACGSENLVCRYPSQTCRCMSATWACDDCPMSQPAAGGACSSGQTLGLVCQYGRFGCRCDGSGWNCGLCPIDPPAAGTTCGSVGFACDYPAPQSISCNCAGTWNCATLACPQQIGNCPATGVLTCQYGSELCSCRGCPTCPFECSCPPAQPAEGSACAGAAPSCRYPTANCTCVGGSWRCPSECPATAPTNGDACAGTTNCTYGPRTCGCDAGHWLCQG